MRFRPQDEGVVRDGGRRHKAAFQLVLRNFFELSTWGKHRCLAFLTEEIGVAVRKNWRR